MAQSLTNQPAPMPKNYSPDAPHPEIIRTLDSHSTTGDHRNCAYPFGDNPGDDTSDSSDIVY